MNRKRLKNLLRTLLPAACLLGGSTREADASSYATQLSNQNGTISFRLNDAADNVTIRANNGAVNIDLGALPAGVTSRDLSAQGIAAGTPFEVVVFKVGSGTIAPIGANVPFNAARGVSVNVNPISPYFGRVYIANTAAGAGATPRGDGIYVFNSDMTETFEQGATARTGGLSFAASTTASPYRLKVGQDDSNLYIADWSDASGNLYVTDPDVTTGSFALKPLTGTAARPVGEANNHGSIVATEVLGSLAESNLTIYTVDEDYQTDPAATAGTEQNSLWRYDAGAGPLPWETAPNQKLFTPPFPSTSQTVDLAYSKINTYFYLSQRRSNGTEPGLYVLDSNGVKLWDSLAATRAITAGAADFLADTYAVAVSADAKWVATIAGNNVVTVMPLTIEGTPDIAARVRYTGFATTTGGARSIAFDRANNLYVVVDTSVTAGSGLDVARALSLGFTARATTSSAGTFSLETPDANVSAVLVDDLATVREGETVNLPSFRITRVGGNTAAELIVNFTVAGTATRGASGAAGDYHLKANGVTLGNATSITIPAGEESVTIQVAANDDTESELSETVIFNLAGGLYNAVAPLGGTITITDNDPRVVDISALNFNQMYEGNPRDRVRVTLRYLGDRSLAPFTVNIGYSGTAQAGVDFTPEQTVAFEQVATGPDTGLLEVTKSFDIFPINDAAVEGNETLIISVAAGDGYTRGSGALTAGATATIVDDDLGPEEVLWSDAFQEDTSANYDIRSSSEDIVTNFAFDYAANLNVPPAPSSPAGETYTGGLYLTVNKSATTATDPADGVNLYPKDRTFSGDYALRFDMFLIQNAGAATTENAIFGINHSGDNVNYFRYSGTGVPAGSVFDGLFASVIADASSENPGAYALLGGPAVTTGTVINPTILETRTAASLADVFHQPPWTAGGGAGSPSNLLRDANGNANPDMSWAEVELSQVDNVVTLKINNTVIFTHNNTTREQAGKVMLGYVDAFDSVPAAAARSGAVIYDNVRVIRVANTTPSEIRVTSASFQSGNLVIEFTSSGGEPASAFKVFASNNVASGYTEDTAATATITATANGYRATIPATGTARFFLIRK